MGAAADVEAAGEDAFGGDAAFRALLHGLPEGEDAGADLVFGGEFGAERGRAYLRGAESPFGRGITSRDTAKAVSLTPLLLVSSDTRDGRLMVTRRGR